MKARIYSVFDAKMAVFSQLHIALTDAAAIRQFSDVINNKHEQNHFARHPEDYSLYFIGEMDDDSGELIASLPKSLITASALLAINEDKSPMLPLQINGRGEAVN